MNPATAFGLTFSDELIRCGLSEVVLAPGSRSTPLAMAFYEAARQRRLRLHVRIDERSASFTALGLAKASRRPAVDPDELARWETDPAPWRERAAVAAGYVA